MQPEVATLSQTQKKKIMDPLNLTKKEKKKKKKIRKIRQECKLNIQVLKKLTKMTVG